MIIIITNMLLYPGDLEREVTLWNCIQARLTRRTSRQGLTLTPAAAAHIRELAAKQPGMLGVRLSVKQTGCAGFGYVLDTVREPDKDDLVFEAEGAKLFAPLQAMPLLTEQKWITCRKG